MASRPQDPESLDALLDDALEDFEVALPVKPVEGSSLSTSEACEQQEKNAGTSEGASSAEAGVRPATAASGLPTAKPATTKGLAFNPLGRPMPSQRSSGTVKSVAFAETSVELQAQETVTQSEALRATAAAAGLEDLGDIDDLSAGLSKLLAELANVDDDTLARAAADMESEEAQQAESAQRARRAQQGDLASTLRALAEQSPSFTAEGSGEDPLHQLGAHPEMASLVDSIMQQLLSKDVLYQPMKDIGARYPSWLDAHKDSLTQEDHQRYSRQYDFIQQICALYESNPSDYAQLVNLLQQMQQCGQPPQEIVDELAPGMQFDADGLPRFPGTAGGAGGDLPPELAECSIM